MSKYKTSRAQYVALCFGQNQYRDFRTYKFAWRHHLPWPPANRSEISKKMWENRTPEHIQEIKQRIKVGRNKAEKKFTKEQRILKQQRQSTAMKKLIANGYVPHRFTKAELQLAAKKRTNFKSSSIERIIVELFKENKINGWRSHYYIREANTFADQAFPKEKLAIYEDGDYWHSLIASTTRDAEINLKLILSGWSVVRLSEKHIKTHPKECLKIILKQLEHVRNTSPSDRYKITLKDISPYAPQWAIDIEKQFNGT